MDLPNKEEIKKWLKTSKTSRESLADALDVAKTTIDQWLSKKDIPLSQHAEIARMMNPELDKIDDGLPNKLNVEILDEPLSTVEWAANHMQTPIRQFIIESAIARAREMARQYNVEPIGALSRVAEESETYNKANLHAAAGNGIEAELIDWVEGAKTLNLQLHGLSASPMFNDGQIIEMAPKHLARGSRRMAKGKFYLVRYEGKLLFKRFNTRPARPDEKDADYLTPTGSVGLLESVNPDSPTIEVTNQECEWLAWLEKDGAYPKDLKK